MTLNHYPNNVGQTLAVSCLNMKMASCWYRDPHYKDKTVDRLIFIMRIPIPGKTVFTLRWGPDSTKPLPKPMLSVTWYDAGAPGDGSDWGLISPSATPNRDECVCDKSALVQVMAWCQTDLHREDTLLSGCGIIVKMAPQQQSIRGFYQFHSHCAEKPPAW